MALDRLRGFVIGGPKNPLRPAHPPAPRPHRLLRLGRPRVGRLVVLVLRAPKRCSGSSERTSISRSILVVAIIGTVFLISASYSQIIEQFPSGGGGYLVATKLLGPMPGVVSGCALVVDYVLTISISVAAGCDAIFSFLPAACLPWKLVAELVVVGWLILLNLRGIKESVYVLTPIFLAFIASHIALIAYGVFRHASDLGPLLAGTVQETHGAISQLGLFGVGVILLRAFSLGGGTFTGIEAVSNGVGILREPRVQNGKRTMLYMATSLAFTAGGILFCYLLNHVSFQTGKTLNASLWELLTRGWHVGGSRSVPGWWDSPWSRREPCSSWLPRPDSSMVRGPWPPWRPTSGCPSDSIICPSGWSRRTGSSAWAWPPARCSPTPRARSTCWSSCTRSTCSSPSRSARWGWRGTGSRSGPKATGAAASPSTSRARSSRPPSSPSRATLKFAEGAGSRWSPPAPLIGLCFGIRQHYRRVRSHLSLLDETLTNLPIAQSDRSARAGARWTDRDRPGRIVRRTRHSHAAVDPPTVPASLQECRLLLGGTGRLGPVQGSRRARGARRRGCAATSSGTCACRRRWGPTPNTASPSEPT